MIQPLLRAEVPQGLSRLDSPLEKLAEDALHACLPLLVTVVKALRKDFCELGRSRDANESHLAILDDLVGGVLRDIHLLGTPPSADDAVAPLDAHGVVLDHGRRRRLG